MLIAVAITAAAWLYARIRPVMAPLAAQDQEANLARLFAGVFPRGRSVQVGARLCVGPWHQWYGGHVLAEYRYRG